MGQLMTSQEELSGAHAMIGSLLYSAMLEEGALPDLGVGNSLMANPEESQVSRSRLQEHLRQLQGDMGKRAPTYLKDLIGRLSAFSDEPKLAGLVGLVVSMVMEMVYASSRGSSTATQRSSGSASPQLRVLELQEVMEEYLKRCRLHLSDQAKLIQDTIRLEAQLSLLLTQLKSSLLGQRCDTRGLRQWASAALFHAQMLVHLAGLEGSRKPLAAQAALEQYEEDLRELIAAYRGYKSSTVVVVKCRGTLRGSLDADPPSEPGAMTGLTLIDRETGSSVSVALPDPALTSPTSLDLITSDQYARDYLQHLFGLQGPVVELQEHFLKVRDSLSVLREEESRGEPLELRENPVEPEYRTQRTKSEGTSGRTQRTKSEGTTHEDRRTEKLERREGGGRGEVEERREGKGEVEERRKGGNQPHGWEDEAGSLKLSIVETEPVDMMEEDLYTSPE